jgi:crotonobetainyl-CoA:carnitine CoA-transferase CaiB-like acyl-CoA transferase
MSPSPFILIHSACGGFDQLAQTVTGFAAEEGGFDSPTLPPTELVNDYLAALLGSIGVNAALMRRATEGGSWQVHIGLAQVCTWVRSLGMFDAEMLAKTDLRRPKTPAMCTVETAFGPLTYLPTQVSLSRLEPSIALGSTPWGADALSWSD